MTAGLTAAAAQAGMRTLEIQNPDGTPMSVTGRLSPDGRTLTYIAGVTPVVGEAAVGFAPNISNIPVVSRNGLTYVDADRMPAAGEAAVTYLTDATMTSYVARSSPVVGGRVYVFGGTGGGAAAAWAVAVLSRARVIPRPTRNSSAECCGTAIPRTTFKAPASPSAH